MAQGPTNHLFLQLQRFYLSLYYLYQVTFLTTTMSSRRTYSSSAPNYDTRRPRRTYASPPPESYHGPDFERAGAQEKYWNSKGMRDVYHPFGELDDPIIARPDTYGLAHDFREPRLEHKYSDPYEKRPNPTRLAHEPTIALTKGPQMPMAPYQAK